MPESKRIFNAGKMNRDLDDRLVPAGEYRDALNVGIGRSEGSDVGAVENLKGNELVAGQDAIEGTTIGHVRDPNTNNIYWFTKGTTVDAIYEYQSDTNTVNPILVDSIIRDNVQPSCAPDIVTMISTPVSDMNMRDDVNFDNRYSTPRGGCTVQFDSDGNEANNYDATATFDDGSCDYTQPTPTTLVTVAIAGDGTFPNSDSPITLTANASNVLGTVSYLWDTGETTQTIEVSGMDQTITGSVTVTDSGRTAPDNTATDTYSVTFQAVAPTTFTWGFETAYEGGPLPAGLELFGSASGIRTEQGVLFEVPREDSGIRITAADMVWDEVPTRRTENFPTGVSALAVTPTQAEADAGNISTAASSEVFGSYTPTGNAFGRVIWSGGSLRATAIAFGEMNFRARPMGSFNLPVWQNNPLTAGDVSSFTQRTFTGDNGITRTGANISAAFAGHVVGGLRSPDGNNAGTKYLLGTIGLTNYSVAGTVATTGGAMANFNFTITSVTEI